jgi:long-subunit fatty acid transport protein
MVNIEGSGLFEVGIDSLITDLDYTDPENSTNGKFRPMVLPELSLIRKSDDGMWATGIGFYLPAGFGGAWSLNNPLLGEHGYKSLGALAKILPGAAVRLTDRLSVGGTLGVAVSHAELEGPFFLQTGALAGAPTILDMQATGAAPTWGVGLQYEISDRTTLGLAFNDETRFRLDGSADADVFGLGPGAVSSDFDLDADLVWPRSLGLGLTHWLADRHRVSTDVIWFDWSHAFDRIDVKFTDSSNPLFPAILGPEITDSFPLDWRDSVSIRFGYEFFATPCDVLRAGYTYSSPTVPNSTLTPYIPATLEHTFSAGYGKQWDSTRFDIGYQFAFGPEANVHESDVVGGDFEFSTVKAQAHWLFLGLTFLY